MRGQKYLVWKKKKSTHQKLLCPESYSNKLEGQWIPYTVLHCTKKKEWIIQNTVILPTYYKTVEQAGKIQLEEI